MTEEEARELLELAAKAAGITLRWQTGNICMPAGYWNEDEGCYWNPLLGDGDALRLAVKLNLTIVNEPHECEVFSEGECVASEPILRLSMVATSPEVTDPYAATRRAIVRAAAELGKSHD